LWLGVDILASYDSAWSFPSEASGANWRLFRHAGHASITNTFGNFFFALIRVSTSQVRKGGSDLITVGITIMCVVRRRGCDF
jgi:hypothetical protein